MIRQPRFHPDYEASELAASVANHVGAVGRSEIGSFEAEQRDRARVEPGRVESLMAQAQRIFRRRVIELGARGPALFEHQRLIASECAQPVARRSLTGGEPQVAEQVADSAASRDREAGGGGGSLAEVDVRIDEAGGDDAACELDEMSLRTDERFEIRKLTVRDDRAAGDCDRIAAGLSEDETFVQDQVGFPGG